MRSRTSAIIGLGMLALSCLTSRAKAQTSTTDPDIRNIQPFVMIIVDSSGSMEWLPNCTCVTPGCTECLPDCSLQNDVNGEPPAGKKNRWAMLLESLTGKFTDFQCVTLDRTAANGATYDLGYSMPYNQPWSCPSGGPACAYPGTSASPIQLTNGLLDNYAGRLHFGLMTFDAYRTYQGASDLVPASSFDNTLSNTAPGSWSYGGGKLVHYPTCSTDYMIDSGVRNANSPEGGLISIDGAGCSTPPCDIYQTNAAIQSSLLATRTFGATPTAGALDDLYYHFKNDYKDQYSSCRNRYAVLITDGYPDDDFRKYPYPGCNCKAENNCPAGEDPDAMKCPYPTAEDGAYNLVHGVNGDPPQMQQLFVIGMSIADSASRAGLNAIASNGGSTDTDGDGNEAFFADDPAALNSTLDTLFGGLSKPVSRSVPAFATGLSGVQYQISAGFQIANGQPVNGIAIPWQGIIERRRFLCDGLTLSSPAIDSTQGDRFQDVLNSNPSTARVLWTAMPSGTVTRTMMDGQLTRADSTTLCGTGYCANTSLDTISSTLFNVDDTTKTTLVDWMYGAQGSVREHAKLGDIYHSSPAIVGPPTDTPDDDAYTTFRDSAAVVERPLMMYIGTNDGILHAFSVETFPQPSQTLTLHPGSSYAAGQEVWGFVPPLEVDQLSLQLASHQLSMDGTPVVKDVYFTRDTTAQDTSYHTVLITGMRGGGKAYVALDVTDPLAPKFLWQFTDPDMGFTYGQPEIVQALYQWPEGQPATLRAMAILPGGVGQKGSGPGCSGSATPAMTLPTSTGTFFKTATDTTGAQTFDHRHAVQCWGQQGRALYFVDVETGKLIKKIFDSDTDVTNGIVFPSPISGSPTAYQDAVSTVATEGFVMDADGVMWRIDLTASDPLPNDPYHGWTVRPFHDVFWDNLPSDDQTTYEKPILSLDDERRVVVITGTGNTDNFDLPNATNRVVSLTEITSHSPPTSPDDYEAALNWEMRVDNDNGFVPSELVTGEMTLFDRQLQFASFISVANTGEPCDFGRGRLWDVDFTRRDLTDLNPMNGSAGTASVQTYGPMRLNYVSTDPTINTTDSGANLYNVSVANSEVNLLIQGLGTTQQMSCQASTPNFTSYFAPQGFASIQQQGQPSIWVVAQASSSSTSRNRAGSALGSLAVQVLRQNIFSRVTSWAGSIE